MTMTFIWSVTLPFTLLYRFSIAHHRFQRFRRSRDWRRDGHLIGKATTLTIAGHDLHIWDQWRGSRHFLFFLSQIDLFTEVTDIEILIYWTLSAILTCDEIWDGRNIITIKSTLDEVLNLADVLQGLLRALLDADSGRPQVVHGHIMKLRAELNLILQLIYHFLLF